MKKKIIIAGILTVIMAVMDITGFPCSLFINIHVLDINPGYFALMFNFLLIGLVCFLGVKIFIPDWKIGFNIKKTGNGIRRYGLAGILTLIATFLAFYIGLKNYDNNPSWQKIMIEGFVYYIGVAFVEELYVRGFLLNIIEKLLYKNKNAVLLAVIISSVIFGVGHIFGSLGSPTLTIVCKVVWTIGLGMYFGAVYKKTDCLWTAIVLHALIDFSAVPFCFTKTIIYPTISLLIILPVYLLLGIYGVYILLHDKK